MKKVGILILKWLPAIILLQTLYFKFTASPESVYIFEKLGMEPAGRLGTGILELVASILLLLPKTTVFGALLGLGMMMGAIVSHIFVLGIEVQDDSGLLFALATVTALCCIALLFLKKEELFQIFKIKF